MTRRRFISTAGAGAGGLFGASCRLLSQSLEGQDGRLVGTPRSDRSTTLESGPLGLGDGRRDGVIQLPSSPGPGPLPLLVFLHGATQTGAGLLRRIGPAADEFGAVVVLPDSRDTTWDAIRGRFGEDVVFLNRVLAHVFERVAIDPARVAIGGFSDGASYGLSLGLANGDLFSRVVACSPGFVIPAAPAGHARFFVSHGTADQILPIEQCSRVIVPRLRAMGYDVSYKEFEGRHELPADVAREALRWMVAP